jgi:hypothetical protein
MFFPVLLDGDDEALQEEERFGMAEGGDHSRDSRPDLVASDLIHRRLFAGRAPAPGAERSKSKGCSHNMHLLKILIQAGGAMLGIAHGPGDGACRPGSTGTR